MRVRLGNSLIILVCTGGLLAADWPQWRGAEHTGASEQKNLISRWSPEGENLLWRVSFTGRSTPVVLNGRVCVVGRVGEETTKQEQVVCFDSQTGKLLWEKRFNVFLTTVPFPRVGWASLAGDPETGNLYFHGVGGLLIGFAGDGRILWQHSLSEEFGRYSGFGGRTFTPIVDGDLVVLGFVSGNWGAHTAPRHRYYAFDKRTGEVVWVSDPGRRPADLNTYSTPVAAEIGGKRLLIGGNGDGSVYALKIGTGELVWSFQLSQRGLNASVVVEGHRVFAGHSEENLDSSVMGRLVAIDGRGTGDVTQTRELWRRDGLTAGFASPAVYQGRVYAINNSANLYVLSSQTGKSLGEVSLGTVGKGSPVIADGKLFATEVNGRFHVLSLETLEILNTVQLSMASDRYAEIYGSPAIAEGRVYFASEEGLYCLGKTGPEATPTAAAPEGEVAGLRIKPGELLAWAGQEFSLSLGGFDANGRHLGDLKAESWTVPSTLGQIGSDGILRVDPTGNGQVGTVTGIWGGLEAQARVRAFPSLPWSEDFEEIELGKFPSHWIGAAGKFGVIELEDGNRVLEKPRAGRGIQRSYVYVGHPEMSRYSVQVDLLGVPNPRRKPDVGLIANRYILSLEGNYQRLSVHSWASEKRMYSAVEFPWEGGAWYTMKMRVGVAAGEALIEGKVWRRDEAEPDDWTIQVRDGLPNNTGTPGLYGQSYANIYYDNLEVTSDQE